MSKAQRQPETLIDAIRYFADPDTCIDFMVKMRWPDGVECPTCGSREVRYISTRRLWECKTKHAKRQFSAKVGTIFEDSPIALDKWLATIWLLANSKNGVSSYEIARSIGVTQKTAWFMLQRIRLAMQSQGGGKLSGSVEVDETYIGGSARFMHKSKRPGGTGMVGKVAVMGLLARETGEFQYRIPESTRKESLDPEVRRSIEAGSNVYTDALGSYKYLNDSYVHRVIDHAEKYAEGEVHTNGLENFWSLLKRAIKGTYVSVEPFHLFRYLDEQAFRFNNRKASDGGRFSAVTASTVGRRVTYKQLTGHGLPAGTVS